MRRARLLFVVAFLPAAAFGCNAILGIEGASFVASDDGGGAEDGSTTDGPGGGGGDDGGDADAPACPADAALASDRHNCGRCGHDCLGGACVSSRCQPVTLATEADIDEEAAIHVDATHVYWTNNRTKKLMRVAKGGGAAETLYENTLDFGNGFAIAGTDVYFPITDDDGGIAACATTGCRDAGARVLIHGTSLPIVVANGAPGTIVWTELPIGGRVGTCTLPCNENATYPVQNEQRPMRIAADDGGLFWTTLNTGEVRAREGSGAPFTLATLAFLRGIVVKGERVFVTVGGEGPYVVPRDGGTAKRVASDGTYSLGLAADDTWLWFTKGTANGAVQRCALASCAGAEDFVTPAPYAAAMTVDDDAVYWISAPNAADGKIMKVAK